MINLFTAENTNWTQNGTVTLQPIRAEVTLSVNGAWSLEIEVPYDKDGEYEFTQGQTTVKKVGKWNFIDYGTIITVDMGCVREQWATGHTTSRQRFRVYDYRKTLSSVVAVGYPVGMECTEDVLIDNFASETTPAGTMQALQAETDKYTLSAVNLGSDTKPFSISHSNLNYAIASGDAGSFIDVFGGEMVWDNLNIKVVNKIGDQNNATKKPIIYGRNMTGIQYEQDISNLVTEIHPISEDGIELNGADGYVRSSHINDYPVVYKRYMKAPFKLYVDSDTDNSYTAQQTEIALNNIAVASALPSKTVTENLISQGYPYKYIKSIKSKIIEAVQKAMTTDVYDEGLKKKIESAIKDGMESSSGAFSIVEHNWSWHENTSVTPHAWWYGWESDGTSPTEYAKNEYLKIGSSWYYFNNDGYWLDYKAVPYMQWYQAKDLSGRWCFGYYDAYYAHNEYVYMTISGQMKEWWYDSEGWYDDDSSGDSDFGWHGDSTSGIWFGEEDAGSSDKSKYLHDKWAFIDGYYYWFDEWGYTDGDPVHSLPDYEWGNQTDEVTGKEWFGNTDKLYGSSWVMGQWIKIDSDYYYFDDQGYMRDMDSSEAYVISQYVSALGSIKTTVNTQTTNLYTFLYQQMTEYCQTLYTNGADLPTLTLNVSMVDLSKTIDYKGYEGLERVCLGDKVICRDKEHGITSEERVMGLTYDCIRGYNTNVVIGHTESTLSSALGTSTSGAVPAGFDTTALTTAISTNTNAIASLESRKQDKLTPGQNITISNNVISATGGQGLQYWHETPNRFYREGTHEGVSGLANYLKPSNNEIGYWESGQGWSRCIVVRLKGNPRNVIMGYTLQTGNKHPILCFASNSVLDFEWGWSNNTLNPPYGVTEWQDKSTYPVPTEGYDWYFGWGTATAIYEGTTWNILAVDCLYWDGGDEIDSTDGLSGFSLGKWNNKPDISLVGYDLLETANAVPYTEVVVEIGTDTYAFKYGGDDKTYTYVDTDGNALFKEITTDAGSLTQQMAQKQNLLTAGSNIQINEGTISATDTTYEEFDGDSAGLVPAVQTQSGKFLKDDGTWDTPSGGGGGGSGSGGSMTTLYTASNETAPSTITLDDSVTNYDMIIVNVMPPTSGISTLATVSNTYIVNCLVANCVLGAQAGSYHAWYYYTNATTLTQYVTAGGYYIKSVVGVKFDGGSGGGGEYYSSYGRFNINGIGNNTGMEAYINE